MIPIRFPMSPSSYDYQHLIAHIWKAKQLSQIFCFLSESVTPFTDKRPDLIIRNLLTDTMQFEKFELLMKGSICYLLMLGKTFKVRFLNPSAPHAWMQLEDEMGAVIDFEVSEGL